MANGPQRTRAPLLAKGGPDVAAARSAHMTHSRCLQAKCGILTASLQVTYSKSPRLQVKYGTTPVKHTGIHRIGWLHQHRGHTKRAPIFPSAKLSIRTSPQHTTWLILKEPPSAKAYLEELYRASPEIAAIAHLGREFFRLVRSRDLAAWPQWLERANIPPSAASHPASCAISMPWKRH